jgi:hypothetical protein
MDILIIIIIIFLFIGTLVYHKLRFSDTSIDDIINYKQEQADIAFKQHILKINDINKDITLEPVGCFNNLYNKFFLRKINPFNKLKEFDSGITISQNTLKEDYLKIIEIVSNNGFQSFATYFKNKYSKDFSKVPLKELGALALFSGYSYVSICKFNENTISQIFLTYSPPMERHNITGNFDSDEYNKYLSPVDSDISTCGFTCGDGSKYKCGSISYPNIKSDTKYAVYHIKENV